MPRHIQAPQYNGRQQRQRQQAAHQPQFLTDHGENKIRVPVRQAGRRLALGLRAAKQPLPEYPSAAQCQQAPGLLPAGVQRDFLQPLLVLAEIPIDVAFALLLLWLCGHTLNLMSAIGLIVTCGIVINDSILKLDAINELRKAGVPLLEAIHEAGRRRLRPIIMTSLTTIFAMVPLLFSSDMGSELQKPLSIAMIGTMSVGTAVSLFIIPLLYWFIYRKKEEISSK